MTTVGIVGAGAVGQAVGCALVAAPISDGLLVASRMPEQASALACDLHDQRHLLDTGVQVRAGTVEDLTRSCEVIVIAARAKFVNTNRRDIRMGGLRVNAPVIADLAHRMRGYPGTVLMVTNPVDVLARLFAEHSGCTVWGIGSNLDSARYRTLVARALGAPADVVTGHVIGEHGEAAVVCAASTTVEGRQVAIPEQVHTALQQWPKTVADQLGRVRAGAAGAVVSTLRKTLGLADGVEELSTRYADGCWLGLPVTFTAGRADVTLPPLSPSEEHAFQRAATKLHAAYRDVSLLINTKEPTQ